MSDYATIQLDVSRAGVAVVLLNRPDEQNALNAQVIDELRDVFDALSKTPEVRVVILRGAGDTFSSGSDLVWMRAADDYSEKEFEEDALAFAEMLRELHDMPQMTIAMIDGPVKGGAAGLVAACDIGISLESATFQFSEVRLGVAPAVVAPYVVKAIGARWARILFQTADEFDGIFAERIGLVHYLAETETELDDLAESLTQSCFEAAPGAIAESKRIIDAVDGAVIDHALSKLTAKRLAHLRASEEGREGLSALVEGRRPHWNDAQNDED